MTRRAKYGQSHWDEYTRLIASGLTGAKALEQMAIPKGSLGTLKTRFNGTNPAVSDEPNSPVEGQSIGELAHELDAYTERLLNLVAQLSELTSHARGLALLDETLQKLEYQQHEVSGVRRQLAEAEKRLISRAMVVHSND
jgi:ribosomal protein L29